MNYIGRKLMAALTLSLACTALPAVAETLKLTTLEPILRNVTPGVVALSIKRRPTDEEVLLSGEPPQEGRQVQSAASGVIFDAQGGLIVTCAHLVAEADEIKVILSDGRETLAERIGMDAETDIAVLKISASKLTSMKLGDSDLLRVGDFVISVWNPFGLVQTISFGVVSALRRSGAPLEGYDKLIQTDASMNPGDSGGALVNLRGELVGVDTAIAGITGTNVGIGFALPVNLVRHIADELVLHGEVRRGHLGIVFQDLDADIRVGLGLGSEQHGVVVSMVSAGSAAERAGIVTGDVITDINGAPVANILEARSKLSLIKIGEVAHVAVVRSAKNFTIDAPLAPPAPRPISGEAMSTGLRGAEFDSVSYFVPVAGAQVVSVQTDSEAWNAGLREGDIIRSLNNEAVTSPGQLLTMVKTAPERLLFNLIRNGSGMFLTVPAASIR
ncbi:MAG: trypsin-like peptidase domain-containing protein [Candidatus Binatia bacterium]